MAATNKNTLGTSDHVEIYGYDANLDYLTSAQYVTGGSTTTWSYDAAGNRNDATVVDNLNRATTIGGVSRTYDILGNTTAIGTHSMTWDCLNRMTGYTNGTSSITNTYRADGMRVEKASTLNPSVHTDYGYDGQMTIEEYNYRNTYPASSPIKLIRYGIGARGVDWIERTDATTSVVTTGYPIYDAHGNMVATLEKGSSLDTYVINDQRNYDAWGGIIKGNTSGEPNGRYCANLGHLQDDESGFVYMQARYYDASCGRFLSQDKGRSGSNWFLYCKNDPANRLDRTGQIDYVDLYHVFYQASDEFLQGLWEAAQEAADSSDPSIIAEYIAENWNAEVLQFSKGAVWRGLRGTTVRLTVEAEELEAQGFSVDMSKVLEVQNEMAEVGRLIGVAEEVQVFDFE